MGGNKVLETTGRLIKNPKYVFIDLTKLEEVAKELSQEKLIIPAWNFPEYLKDNGKTLLDSFMLGNSLNFAFTDFKTKNKFSTEYKGKQFKGSSAMWVCIKRAFESGVPILEGRYLKDISKDDARKIFAGNIKIPMFKERLKILREVGTVLCQKYGGHFYNLVFDSEYRLFNNGKGLVERLTKDFPSFDDSVVYEGNLIRFDKRAQLAPAMIYGRLNSLGIPFIEDIDELTVFADYVLPKTLRDLGIFIYENSLAERIDNQQIIPSKSQEELELRAATIHASKGLMDKLNQYRDDKVNTLHIDYALWSMGRKIKSDKPHHLTITTAY